MIFLSEKSIGQMMMRGFVVGQFLSDDKDNNAINGAQCSHGICYHVASLIYQVWGNGEGEMIWVFLSKISDEML